MIRFEYAVSFKVADPLLAVQWLIEALSTFCRPLTDENYFSEEMAVVGFRSNDGFPNGSHCAPQNHIVYKLSRIGPDDKAVGGSDIGLTCDTQKAFESEWARLEDELGCTTYNLERGESKRWVVFNSPVGIRIHLTWRQFPIQV